MSEILLGARNGRGLEMNKRMEGTDMSERSEGNRVSRNSRLRQLPSALTAVS